MNFSRSLISHAIYLAANGVNGDLPIDATESGRNIADRRAVSAAYYALFHHLNSSAVDLIAPHVDTAKKHRIQRGLGHGEMKEVCSRFLSNKLSKPLNEFVGEIASNELRSVAQSFITLQEARINADYNLGYTLSSEETHQFVLQALVAMDTWDRIAATSEANIFILSLVYWKNLEKER